ncbi:MAG: hypothetical protein AAB652_02755 [Patescibacteria group bacterium]
MIRLSFIVDKSFILQHILKSFSDWRSVKVLKHKLWKRNQKLYYILAQNIEPLTFADNFSEELKRAVKDSLSDLSFIYKNPLFRKILKETEKYRLFVNEQWEKNYNLSLMHMRDITKLPLDTVQLNLEVYISHPKLSRGRSYPEQRVIAWAHSEDWKNYSTVYLWHEIMHHIAYSRKGSSHLMHALIELACDNELRVRLNGRGGYFREGEFDVGHNYLVKLERKITEEWKKYLNDPRTNVYQLERKLRSKFSEEFLVSRQSALNEWAEWH